MFAAALKIDPADAVSQKKVQSNEMPKVCEACGQEGAAKCCSGCKGAFYCSIACQTQHWKAGHKYKCFKAEKPSAATAAATATTTPRPAAVGGAAQGSGGGAGASHDEECAICLDALQQPQTMPCGHRFCRGCVASMRRHGAAVEQVCPLCRGAMPDAERLRSEANRLFAQHDRWMKGQPAGAPLPAAVEERLGKAAALCRKALAIDPADARTHHSLGYAQEALRSNSMRAPTLLDLHPDIRSTIFVFAVPPAASVDSGALVSLAKLRAVCTALRDDFPCALSMLAASGSVPAMARIARSHWSGDFGFEESDALFSVAMDRLVAVGSNEALHYAATMFIDAGQGRCAVALWKQAAAGGCPDAIYNYAVSLANGHGGKKDLKVAARLFHAGANKGHAGCQVARSKALWDGNRFVRQNRNAAAELFQVAAAAGDSEGMLCSGMCCDTAWISADTAEDKALYHRRCVQFLEDSVAAGNSNAASILETKAWECLRAGAPVVLNPQESIADFLRVLICGCCNINILLQCVTAGRAALIGAVFVAIIALLIRLSGY